MPSLLRYDTIRLFEASVEALHLAVSSLGAEKRVDFRQRSAEYAIEIGLLGSAAELAMSACMVQARGPEAIKWPSGQYKTAGTILDEFRELVSEPTAASSFLTEGVDDPTTHRTELREASKAFRLLMPVRAGGLHAGRGLVHEAVVIKANEVASCLDLLAISRRLGPYLQKIPRCLWYSRDRAVVIEDLRSKLEHSKGEDRTSTLASIYLVLPDIPEEEPEWLQAFSRVSLAPKSRDIEYLMSTLEDALPASLRRASNVAETVPVRVEPENPDALPIAPHLLRRQLNEVPDLWHADIATANGRLNQGSLDLPPIEAVQEVFALGLERAGVVQAGQNLNAHESWPHIMASLSFQGTLGPYWFLVRRCGDLGQLKALLRQAAATGSTRLQRRVADSVHGIDAVHNGWQLSREDQNFARLIDQSERGKTDKSWLDKRAEEHEGMPRRFPAHLRDQLSEVADGGEPVGALILALLEADPTDESMRYWSGKLAELASEADDVPALVRLLRTPDVLAAHTAARKALHRIDFSVYGPPLIESISA